MIFGIILQIGDLSHAPFFKSAADNRSASGRDGQALKVFYVLTCLAPLARHRIARRKLKTSAARPPDVDHFGTAKLRGRLHQGVEHRLQIESGATDDLQDVGRRRLLLQRFRKVVCTIF